jgi:hypothetical protein
MLRPSLSYYDTIVARGKFPTVGTRKGGAVQEQHHAQTIEQLAAELDHLARDIDQARWDLARCHHVGEPHFCDHATPRFRLALEANLERLNLLEDRWRMSHDQVATERGTPEDRDAARRLAQLGRHLDRIRRNRANAAHEAERHFCDQPD